MISCVYPGSFDPVTKGHIHLISRASQMFDRVTVTVMINIRKTGTIPVDRRVQLLRKACSSFSNVIIDQWSGLLSDYMKIHDEKIVIRGIRNAAEFEQEAAAFYANRQLNNSIETLFIPADPDYTGISSSTVREVASFGGDIASFVPDGLAEEINAFLSNKL